MDDQYKDAKISVWWDIENLGVPKNFNPNCVAKNIRSALSNLNYRGSVSISAYGDTERIPPWVQRALTSTAIAINHVPPAKNAADMKIIVDMMLWAIDNPAPANYLLISGDQDYANTLNQLGMRRYNILLARPAGKCPLLVAAASTVWFWTSLVKGEPPLSSSKRVSPKVDVLGSSRSEYPLPSKKFTGWLGEFETKEIYLSVNLYKSSTELARPSGQSNLSVNPNIVRGDLFPENVEISYAVQQLIALIFLAFDKLRLDKLLPTEKNIYYCIRYGDHEYSELEVKEALCMAVHKQMLVLTHLGQLPFYYLRPLDTLWDCTNTLVMDVHRFPESMWVGIQEFISSSTGKCAITDSECRYHAALILKVQCLQLQHLSLGEILQILNIIILVKEWIRAELEPRWQPVLVTL